MQWCCHSPLKTLPSAPPLSLPPSLYPPPPPIHIRCCCPLQIPLHFLLIKSCCLLLLPSHPWCCNWLVRKAVMAMRADGDGTEIGAWPSSNAGRPQVIHLSSHSHPLSFCWILVVATGTPRIFFSTWTPRQLTRKPWLYHLVCKNSRNNLEKKWLTLFLYEWSNKLSTTRTVGTIFHSSH